MAIELYLDNMCTYHMYKLYVYQYVLLVRYCTSMDAHHSEEKFDLLSPNFSHLSLNDHLCLIKSFLENMQIILVRKHTNGRQEKWETSAG